MIDRNGVIRHAGYTEVAKDGALAIMRAAKFRLMTYPIPAHLRFPDSSGVYTGIEILHDGKWKMVCRTDLTNNVVTTVRVTRTCDEWLSYYLARVALGARFNDELFCVIDAYSDG